MYQPLSPCAGCRRHVRNTEPQCPFCGAAHQGHPGIAVDTSGSLVRMSRAAAVAASLAIVACQSEPQPVTKDPVTAKPAPTPTPGPSTAPSPGTGVVDDHGSVVAEYGAPAPTKPDAGLVDDHGGMVTKYGAPPPPKPPPPKPHKMKAPATLYGAPPND